MKRSWKWQHRKMKERHHAAKRYVQSSRRNIHASIRIVQPMRLFNDNRLSEQ
ncbi:hypothetical protein GOP80_07300 [Planococcaceae bacterium Storch 2/2-2]|nr:hypothetical protein [Planococcaceae bacterium Storch 2/2-2]